MINTKLEEFIARWLGVPFSWGKNDCIHFVADWLSFCGYGDLMPDIKYHDYKSAKAEMTKLGFRNMKAALDAHLKRHKYVLQAFKGDILALESKYSVMPALAIYIEPHTYFGFDCAHDENGQPIDGVYFAKMIVSKPEIINAWGVSCQQ